MGYDYYHGLIYDDKSCLYSEKTKKIAEQANKKNFKQGITALRPVQYLRRKILYNDKMKHDIIKRIDFFAPVLKEEFLLISKKNVAFFESHHIMIMRGIYLLNREVLMRQMRKSVLQLLSYGWQDKTIASYLMIKPTIVSYYRKKHGIVRDEYQGFY